MNNEKEIKIITETLEYYKDHECASLGGECEYTMRDSCGKKTHCAVGRCLKKKFQTYKFSDQFFGMSSDVILEDENHLKNRYLGMGDDFWTSLQCLHDTDYYWIKNTGGFKNKLSHLGINFTKYAFGVPLNKLNSIVEKVYPK